MHNRRLVFDIEANSLYFTVTKAHCIVAIDFDTEEQFLFRPHELEEGVRFLKESNCLMGHNIINYDTLALEKLYGVSFEGVKVFDTLVASKVLDPDRKGGHSLKAWGVRLGILKGDYGEQEEAWDVFSEDMLTYCVQDVVVNVALVHRLVAEMDEEDVPTYTLL